jgi:Icc-related predicted phosphoesterase
MGTVDVSSAGKHLGSLALRETIDRCQPWLVVCGHIHDSSGQFGMVGDTAAINVGPNGVIWELS